MMLDRFQDLLCENLREEDEGEEFSGIEIDRFITNGYMYIGITRTYSQFFLNYVTPDNFAQILAMFKHHTSAMVHAKLAAFIYESLQSSRAKLLLEKVFTVSGMCVSDDVIFIELEVENLSYVAYGISFFSDIPVDIMPSKDSTFSMAKAVAGDNVMPLIRAIYSYYYISVINQTIAKQPFIFVGISQFVADNKKTAAQTLASLFQEKSSEFLFRDLWKFIAHRNAGVSSLFLFLVIQTFYASADSNVLLGLLRSDNLNIVDKIRSLATCKFSHAQQAARRLWKVLQFSPTWLDSIHARLNVDLLLEDLTPKKLPKAPINTSSSSTTTTTTNHNNKPRLVTQIVSEMLILGFAKASETNKSRLFNFLEDSFFQKLLKLLLSSPKSLDQVPSPTPFLTPPLSQTHLIQAELLLALMTVHHRLNSIQIFASSSSSLTSSSQKVPSVTKGTCIIAISASDVQKITLFISECTCEADPYLAFSVKTSIYMGYF